MTNSNRKSSARREAPPTRRAVFKVFSGAAAILGLSATGAEAKSSQAGAAYRSSPKGSQSCANCSWFQPPSGCAVVKGPVSARGWCRLWG